MTRSAASLITGRWVKWVFVVFWVAVLAVGAPLAGKLSDVEKNESKAWLPGGAESVQVLDVQSTFTSPNTIPAVVVYERSSGLTPADLSKMAADAQQFGQIEGLDGKVVGPIPTGDKQAAQTIVPLNLGNEGWNKSTDLAKQLRDIAEKDGGGLTVHIAGPIGQAADSSKAFEGIDSTLLLGTVAVVVVILLFTYRSPILWLLPVISSGVALT